MQVRPVPAALIEAQNARVRHIVGVPGDVDPEELTILAESQFLAVQEVGDTLALSRHSAVSGPFNPQDLRLVTDLPAAYVVECPRERQPAIPFSTGDQDGLRRIFSHETPHREEGRVVEWLVAVGRRLGGQLWLDTAGKGEAPRFSHVVPDPEKATDLRLYSDVWLTPEATERLCQQVARNATVAPTGFPWAGPAAEIDTTNAIHAIAEAADIEALTAPQEVAGYAVTVPLHTPGQVPGLVVVEVAGVSEVPRALRAVTWLTGGGVEYAVRWFPSDDDAASLELPPLSVVQERRAAASLIEEIGDVLQSAAGGEMLDQDGFCR